MFRIHRPGSCTLFAFHRFRIHLLPSAVASSAAGSKQALVRAAAIVIVAQGTYEEQKQ